MAVLDDLDATPALRRDGYRSILGSRTRAAAVSLPLVSDGESGGVARRRPPIDLVITYEGTEALVDLGGDIDVQNAHRLRAAVETALALGSRSITLRCDRITFVDSSALVVLAQAARETRARGGTTTVVDPTVTFRRLLETTGLDTMVTIRSSRRP